MIVSESVSVRGRRRVREGVEGVDVSGSVYVSTGEGGRIPDVS